MELKQNLLSLYKKLILIRLVEEKIAEKYSEREMRCPVHLSIGQEAVAVGVCSNLEKNDLVYSTHRCHAHYLAKGGDLKKMVAEIYGKETGCSGGRGGSMHLIDLAAGFGGATPIVGNIIPIAVGAAFSNKFRNKKNMVTVFLGEGSVEEGVFHESLNFAVLKKLPILFICENNFFSVYTDLLERQPKKRQIYKLVKSYGNIMSDQYDGNDILKVYEASQKSISKIKAGQGPVFLELLTYRMREHCGPNFDDHLKYRNLREVNFWKEKDPVVLFEKYILKNKFAPQKELDKIKYQIEEKIDEAFVFAKKSKFPKKQSMYEKIYSP